MLYDTSYSERGVLLAAARVPRKANPFDYQPPLLVKDYDASKKRRRPGEVPLNPSTARRPDPGMLGGIGRQAGKAKLGSGTKTLLTLHILKTKVCGGQTCSTRQMRTPGGGTMMSWILLSP